MIKTVVREFNWLPKQIGSLFIDNEDYRGLEYWYNDVFKINQPPKQKE